MPELPEVETIRRGLQKLIVGKTVKSVKHDSAKSFPNAQSDVDEFLIGAKVVLVARRAKVLLIELSSKYSLVIHLKMTGQMVYISDPKRQVPQQHTLRSQRTHSAMRETHSVTEAPDRFGGGHPGKSLVSELPDKSTRVEITFSDGSKLFFNDQRKFGWMRLIPTAEVPNIDFMRKVGPEPLSDDFTAQEFIQRLKRRSRTNIKAAILDQTVLAGIGNIYADESLWSAKIHPKTLVGQVNDKKLKDLFTSIREVLELSIAKGGSTDKNYVDAEGKRGSYLSFANVFRREGKPCNRCQTEIIKTRVAGRGTHLCPTCQKEPK